MDNSNREKLDYIASFVRLNDVELLSCCVSLSAVEAVTLGQLLLGLEAEGMVAAPSVVLKSQTLDADAFRALVGATVSEPIVAAVEAAGRYDRSPVPKPSTLMPVWSFGESDRGSTVLQGSGQLWGVDVRLEALRVEDVDLPRAMPGAEGRLSAWRRVVGAEHAFATVRLPEREGHYVVLAWT